MKKLIILGITSITLLTSCKIQKCEGYKDVDRVTILQNCTPIYIIGIDSSEFRDLEYLDYFSVYNLKFKTINKYNVFVSEIKKFHEMRINIVPVGFNLNEYHKELKDGYQVVDTIKYCK
jgi:hypothetical protein